MTTCKTVIPIEIEIKKENKTVLSNSKSVKQTKQHNTIEFNNKKTANFNGNATTNSFNTKSLVNNNNFDDPANASFENNQKLDQKTRLNVQHLSPIKPSFVK